MYVVVKTIIMRFCIEFETYEISILISENKYYYQIINNHEMFMFYINETEYLQMKYLMHFLCKVFFFFFDIL